MPECASKDPASKADNVFRFLLRTSAVLCQSLRITITVPMQLGTMRYNAITFNTAQLHTIPCMSEHTHVYRTGFFWLAN